MIRFFVILFCLTIAWSAPVQEKEKKADTQHNFLFVIDSSLSMAPRKTNTMQMVRQMILSGFEKQIRPGDSIDIWVYDEENHINAFPPQIWEDADARRIAVNAGRFIDVQKFRGRSRFEPVGRDLEALLPNTKQLLIVIITDADEPLSGFPLDLDINQFLATEKRRRPYAKQPFLISIAAVNGRYVQWAAYCDETDRVLANLPPRPKSAPVVAAKGKEPEKKKEPDKPISFDLPPGARLAAPPAPKTEIIAVKPAPTPAKEEKKEPEPAKVAPFPTTNLAAVVAPKATNTPAAQTPKVENSNSNSPALAAKISAEPPAPTPPTSKPQLQPQPQSEIPLDLAAASKPQAVEIKPPAQITPVAVPGKPAQAPTVQSVAASTNTSESFPTAEEKPREQVRPSLAQAILSPVLLYGGVALSGFAIMTLGGLLLLRRAKARQGGSIISRSLLQ